ncbi:hypothetical protein D9M68_956360 [compost metagenome]
MQAANKGGDLKVIGSGARSPNFFLMAGAGLASSNVDEGYPAVTQDFKGSLERARHVPSRL